MNSAVLPELDQAAKTVLEALRERAMDGYTLSRVTGLSEQQLTEAADALRAQELISVKGNVRADPLEAYFYIPPDALGYSDVILNRRRLR